MAWYKGLRCLVNGWELAPALTGHIPHHRETMGGMLACEREGELALELSPHPTTPEETHLRHVSRGEQGPRCGREGVEAEDGAYPRWGVPLARAHETAPHDKVVRRRHVGRSVDGVGLASDWTCARGRDKEGELRGTIVRKFTPLLLPSVSTMGMKRGSSF